MHFCGNPLHDAPLYVLLALPFLAPVVVWLRSRWQKSSCECGHDHANGERHE